jgi:hemolysin activation/secretion protein
MSLKMIYLGKLVLLISTLALSQSMLAAPLHIPSLIPGTVDPGVVSNTITSQQPSIPNTTSPAFRPNQTKQETSLGEQTKAVKFKLTAIILEGNHVYNEKQLLPIYENNLNKIISVADAIKITQQITSFYTNNGYILSQAILPPQEIKNGMLRIRIIEGSIHAVNVIGKPKGAKYLVQEYGNRIAAIKPTILHSLERYLRLMNLIPGMQARAVLEPSKQQVGASDLNLVTNQKTFAGYLSYDNYGTRYIGPNQVTANISVNSIFRSGDSTHITAVRTSRPNELQYIDAGHETPLGTDGMRLFIDGNQTNTQPGLNLRPLELKGRTENYSSFVQYPLILERGQHLDLDGGFYYTDSNVTAFDQLLYMDHLRSVRAGANYEFSDRFQGSNGLSAHIEQGLAGLFGGSNNPSSPTVSRLDADNNFTKLMFSASRLQSLFWRLSLLGYVTGQYSFNPLLASEQFAYGGSQLGRGYDPAAIIGDHGVGGTLELRLDTPLTGRLLQSVQPYIFYDGGRTWNIKTVIGVPTRQSATSAGIGIRFAINTVISGNLMLAQPLTTKIATEEIINGNSKAPRGFFSFVAVL